MMKPREALTAIVATLGAFAILALGAPLLSRILIAIFYLSYLDPGRLLPSGKSSGDKLFIAAFFWGGAAVPVIFGLLLWIFSETKRRSLVAMVIAAALAGFYTYEHLSAVRDPQDIAFIFYGPVTGFLATSAAAAAAIHIRPAAPVGILGSAIFAAVLTAIVIYSTPEGRFLLRI